MNRKVILALGAIALVAGCTSTSTGGTTVSTPPATGGGETTNAELGEIKVGIVGAFSGPFAENQKDMLAGWELGIESLGDNPHAARIATTHIDDAGDPNKALTALRQSIQSEKIDVLVGPTVSNVAVATLPFIKSTGIPTLNPVACATELATTERTENLVLTGWTCDQPSLPFGKYAYDVLGYRNITTIGMDFNFGWQAVGGFVKSFTDAGGTIDNQIWTPISTTDYSVYVSQIGSDTDAVFGLMAGGAGANFLSAYSAFGLKDSIPLIGAGSLTDHSTIGGVPVEQVEGIVTASQWAEGIDSEEVAAFSEAYSERTGKLPSYYAETGYSTARFLVAALESIGDGATGPDELLAAFGSVEVDALRGPVTISAETNSPVQNVYIREAQVVDGKIVNVPVETFENLEPWAQYSQTDWTSFATEYGN